MSAVAAGSIAAAGIGAVGSGLAANTQANAAESAQGLQAQEAANALAQQQSQFNTTQANEAPFIQAGQGAVTQLSSLLQPGGALSQGWNQQFQAPTAAQAAQTPGYQFALQQGENALQNSAAAAGGLGSGATGAALEQYGQGLANTNYQQVYNNALTQYQQSYNQFQQNQANQYNRLAGLSGTGQTAVGQLGQLGQQASNNTSNIALTTGAQQGQQLNNAGAANASGYVGIGNALSGGLNNLASLSTLQQLLGGNFGQSAASSIPYGGY